MGVAVSAIDMMSTRELAQLVTSLGPQYAKYEQRIVDNCIDGPFLANLKEDIEFATVFETLQVDTMHKLKLRQKVFQLRSEAAMNRMLIMQNVAEKGLDHKVTLKSLTFSSSFNRTRTKSFKNMTGKSSIADQSRKFFSDRLAITPPSALFRTTSKTEVTSKTENSNNNVVDEEEEAMMQNQG